MPGKKLTKSKTNKWLGGVIGGIGEYFGLDDGAITLIRIFYLVLLIPLTFGSLFLIYLIAWLVIPSDESPKASNDTRWQSYDRNSQPEFQERKIKEAEVVDEKKQDDWSDF